MNQYKVGFAKTLNGEYIISYIHVKAKDEESASNKVKKLCHTKEIISTRKVRTWNEWLLERWYYIDPDSYIIEWEPEITTEQMIKKMRKYPELWERLH